MKEYSKIGEKKKNMSCYIVEMEIGWVQEEHVLVAGVLQLVSSTK